MADGTTPPETRPSGALRGVEIDAADWPVQAADAIERLVGRVRELTTGRAITAARIIVYGLFAAIVGLVVAILLAIAAVRLLDAYLPDDVVGEDHTWVAHLLIGAVFTIGGMVLWAKRTDGSADAE